MSFPKPQKIETPAAAPPTPDITPAEQKLGSAENPAAAALDKRKKGRSALRIDLQHGGSGLSAGQTGVNVPSK